MLHERSSLAPSLLVAMPQLADPNFNRAVVLLWEHRDEGAMGLIINRPTETRASQIVQLDPPVENDSDLTVWIGGPVDPTRGWLLIAGDDGDGSEIMPGLYLSASVARLRQAMESNESANHCRFLVGYSGWGRRQLDTELAASAWLTVPLEIDLVFRTPSELMWETAIRRLGIDPTALAMGPGVH